MTQADTKKLRETLESAKDVTGDLLCDVDLRPYKEQVQITHDLILASLRALPALLARQAELEDALRDAELGCIALKGFLNGIHASGRSITKEEIELRVGAAIRDLRDARQGDVTCGVCGGDDDRA